MPKSLVICLLLLFSLSFQVLASESQVRFFNNIFIEEDERMVGDMVVIGGTMDIKGELQGDAICVGGKILLKGKVQGNVIAVGSSVDLLEGSNITGDLKVIGGSITRNTNVRIGRSYSHINPLPRNILQIIFQSPSYIQPFRLQYPNILTIVFSFFFQLLLLLLIIYFFPSNVQGVRTTIEENLGSSLLVGFIGLLVAIPLMIFLLITILGIPLALLTPVFYWMAITLGRIGIYYGLGQWAQRYLRVDSWKMIPSALFGLSIYFFLRLILHLIPFIGRPLVAIITFLIYIIAFGSSIQSRFGTGKPWFKEQT